MQFNVNENGVPTYEDYVSDAYDHGDNCTTLIYTTLDQYGQCKGMTISKELKCEQIEKNKYNCTSTVISTWVRIWDTTYYKDVIDHCGMQWHEQYQDVM